MQHDKEEGRASMAASRIDSIDAPAGVSRSEETADAAAFASSGSAPGGASRVAAALAAAVGLLSASARFSLTGAGPVPATPVTSGPGTSAVAAAGTTGDSDDVQPPTTNSPVTTPQL